MERMARFELVTHGLGSLTTFCFKNLQTSTVTVPSSLEIMITRISRCVQ